MTTQQLQAPGTRTTSVEPRRSRRTRMTHFIEALLSRADIRVGGDRPQDIQVHDPRFFDRVAAGGVLALGESYMDGWWDCRALDDFFFRVLSADLREAVGKSWREMADLVLTRAVNYQTRSRAQTVARRHYDLGNDLFTAMLDSGMNYSCAYWDKATNLDEAQEAKLDLICRKIDLQPGMRVLDIGCGWGGFARFAALNYNVHVTGVTISREQVALGRIRCENLPVDIRLQDYRDVDETFDRVVSIGMFEHVGAKNYRTFMEVAARSLKRNGLMLLHTIGSNVTTTTTDPWTARYIFPNSSVPSSAQITNAAERLLRLEDWHNIGTHYDPTLMAWCRNFEANWSTLVARYGPRFYRMWRYFLLSSAGSFRARHSQTWQIVLAPLSRRMPYARPE